MKYLRQLACLMLAVAMLFTGCSGAGDLTWAYRAGDLQVPIGIYIYYMHVGASDAQMKLQEERDETSEQSESSEEQAKTYKQVLKETMADGTAVSDYIVAEAERYVREYVAVEQKFAEMGLALTENELTLAANNAESARAADEELYDANGIAESSLRMVIENSLKRQAIFKAIYDEGGTTPVSEKDLQDEFVKSYTNVDMIYFRKDTAEGADNSGLKAKAESYLKRAQDGEDFYELIYEREKERAEDQEKAEAITKPEAGSRTILLSQDHRSYYGDALVDGVFNATIGEPTLIEDEEGDYYLILRSDVMDQFTSYRTTMLYHLKGEEYDGTVAGWAESAALEPNPEALKKYTPQRLTVQEN